MWFRTVLAATLAAFQIAQARPAGQFPQGTDVDVLEVSNPVSYYIGSGLDVAGYDPVDDDLARLAFAAWARESGGQLRFTEVGSPERALVRLVWVSATSGLFGQTQRTLVDGKPGALVFVTPQVRALGPELAQRIDDDQLLRDAIVYLTCVHELGHAVGLPHTAVFDDIMYSFSFGGDIVRYFMRYRNSIMTLDDISRYSGLSDGDRVALHRLYP